MSRTFFAALAILASIAQGSAQTPQPFPRPGSQPARPAPPPPAPQGQGQAPAIEAPVQPAVPAPAPAAGSAPTEAMLGAPVFPGAQFLASYDAGRGQRYYLFGAGSIFSEVVTFYRTALKQRGEVLFESPATHMFETARYRDDAMAFPPSVTIKDYSSGGSPGYPNTAPRATLTHFPTIIQIVPAPAAQ